MSGGSGLDLHNSIKPVRVVSPAAVGATGTGSVGKIVDRRGYGGLEFLINYGSITATNATFTPIVLEGDTTGAMTSVADGDLIGTESGAGIAAGTPRTSGTNKNLTKKIGYKGKKRYASVTLRSTVTAATIVSVEAILFAPTNAPTP